MRTPFLRVAPSDPNNIILYCTSIASYRETANFDTVSEVSSDCVY